MVLLHSRSILIIQVCLIKNVAKWGWSDGAGHKESTLLVLA